MDFVGLDGNVWSLPFATSDMFDGYSHYLIFRTSGVYQIILFNGNSLNLTTSGIWATYSSGDNGFASYYYSNGGGLEDKVFKETVKISNSLNLIVVSDSLLPYSTEILSGNASIVLPETVLPDISVTTTTLRPIIEEQENITEDIFSEMFGILPVLIVVLVSFVGIRKAIAWLSSFLKKS